MSLGSIVRRAVSALTGRHSSPVQKRHHHRDPKAAAAKQAVKEVSKAARR